MSDQDWRDEELLPEQTSDDVDQPTSTEATDDDVERLLREVPPHHDSKDQL